MKRRSFMLSCVGGAVGLTLVAGFGWRAALGRRNALRPFAWLAISPENEITVKVSKNEMGQGASTSLAMIVAEELDADWSSMRFELCAELGEFALPTDVALPGTADSNSVRSRFHQMRMLGATARQMLLAAAATQWAVDISSLRTHKGVVIHPAKGFLKYGELADAAKSVATPGDFSLKDRKDFTIIGTSPVRLDARIQVEGSAEYGIDVAVPDLVYASVILSPVAGGEVQNFSSLNQPIPKVIALVPLPGGLAVVAESWWEANRVLRSLDVRFNHPPEANDLNSGAVNSRLSDLILNPAEKMREVGDPQAALNAAHQQFRAEYLVPYLDHAALEPLNATAHVTDDSCILWAPIQSALGTLQTAMEVTGLPEEAISIRPTFLGGGFGRKDSPTDFIRHALIVSKAVRRPVKVIWSREQDMTHGAYRSAASAALSAGLDSSGNIVAWVSRLAAPQLGWNWLTLSLANFSSLPYAIPDLEIQWARFSSPLRIGFWRSVNLSHNVFFVESFIDELAHLCGADPLEFRLRHTRHNARATAVLTKVGEMSRWGAPRADGTSLGVALLDYTATDDTRTIVAHVAEVSVDESGFPRVHKVYCAVDCGLVVNPDGVCAQVEGGTIFGLTAALYGEISVDKGSVRQRNFNDYRLLSMRDAPCVEVSILDSSDPPAGIGEYGVPGIMPAVTNALFTATGKRVRSLPIVNA